MEIAKVKVTNPCGLHLRPAAKVVQFSKAHKSKILLCRGCTFADTCSILQVISLGAKHGDDIAVIAEGPDEKTVIRGITELFNDGAGI